MQLIFLVTLSYLANGESWHDVLIKFVKRDGVDVA